MRLLSALTCLTISAALVGNTYADRVAHVFLLAGQSNSQGWNSDGHTDEDVSYPNIWQLDCCNNGQTLPVEQCKFNTASDPLHHICDLNFVNGITVGFGMSFARGYREDVPEDDVTILVPTAISGTGFFDNTWTAYTGTGFTKAVSKLKQTFNLLESSYPEYTARFEGIVWQQGTHDAGDNAWGEIANTTYYLENDIIPMINALRDTELLPFTYPELPFLCANLLPSWAFNPDKPYRLGVFNAIAVLDQIVPYTQCTPSYGLVGDAQYPGSGNELLHFKASSNRILGKRYHAAYYLARQNIQESQKLQDWTNKLNV